MLEINDSHKTTPGAPEIMLRNAKKYLNGKVIDHPPRQDLPYKLTPEQGFPEQKGLEHSEHSEHEVHSEHSEPEKMTIKIEEKSNDSNCKLSIIQIFSLLIISFIILVSPIDKILKDPNKFLLIFSKSLLICILFWFVTMFIH